MAAAILYIPANALPVIRISTLLETRSDTIFQGVAALWNSGQWDLAVVVFTASVVVPLVKMLSLAFLMLSVQWRSGWNPEARTRLYRLIDYIGHWSMLDVFVITLLSGLVRFYPYADARPEPGVAAFGAVVVLTMLATMTFDPRLIWDALPSGEGR